MLKKERVQTEKGPKLISSGTQFYVLEVEPGSSCMLDKCSATGRVLITVILEIKFGAHELHTFKKYKHMS